MDDYMELAKAEAVAAARGVKEELLFEVVKALERAALALEIARSSESRLALIDPTSAETFYKSARVSHEVNRELLDSVLTKFEGLVNDIVKVRGEFATATDTVHTIRQELPELVKGEATEAVAAVTAQEVQKLADGLREVFQPVMDSCTTDFQKVQDRAQTLAEKLAKGVALSQDVLKQAANTVAAVEGMKDSVRDAIAMVNERLATIEAEAGQNIAKALSGVPDLMKAMVPMPTPQAAPEVTTNPGTMVWRGAWQGDVTYRKGDVVVYGGATYVADKTTREVPGASQDWALVLASTGGAGFARRSLRAEARWEAQPPSAFFQDTPPDPLPPNWSGATGRQAHVRLWVRTTDMKMLAAVQDVNDEWIWVETVGTV